MNDDNDETPKRRTDMGGRRSNLGYTLFMLVFACLLLYTAMNTFSLLFSPHLPEPPQRLVASDDVATPARPPAPTPIVKIFMYDLPRKFTYGVIEHYQRARGVLKADSPVNNDSELRYPGNQHSAEWWLFSHLSSMDDEEEMTNSSVIRTLDPHHADLFYVSFFSSLSLVVNPPGRHIMRNEESSSSYYSDEEIQEELVLWLEKQPYWRRYRGRDHVIICQDPNALYKVIDNFKNSVLLISDFGRLKAQQASLVKDVVLPYSHRINSFNGDAGVGHRDSLLFFMGNRFRKEGGRVRDMLFQVLEDEEDMIIKHGAQSRESRRLATQGMHTSKFCLHPAGDTPSACRLFDAIVSLCVPVIVSDDIELPFEDIIDYSKIAIFVTSSDAVQPGYLASMLRSVSLERLLQYQIELVKVKRYFEYEETDGAVNAIWRQVASKLPLVNLMINREKRLVKREVAGVDCSCICSNRNDSSATELCQSCFS